MEEMLINERFKSPDKVFEKVYGIFDKRDYFNVKGLAQVQIRNFENFLKKGDKNAQALLDKYKGDNKKAHEYIIQVIHDRKKEQAFEDFKAFKTAVNKLELVSKGKSKEAYGASDLVKSRIHNNSQKYTIALYSSIRGKKFNNKKDVHKDVDDLLAKNEGFSSDAQRKAAFANGYEEKDKKNEGKKRFKRQDGIGKAKYTISYHDGKKKHKDGSDFFDIKIFKNKKDLSDFVGTLAKQGYKLTSESVNEMQVVNKKTGKDITRHVLDLLSGKIDKKKFEKLTGLKKESVNEANSRDEYDAKEFYGDYKLGIQLHKQFKGRFNKSKFQKTLNDLIQKSKRPEATIKIIGRELNIEPRKLNSYTSGEIIEDQEFIKDSTKKAEQLYKIFISTNESVNEAIKGRNNKTGEAFGMVIGSDKKNREGNFEVTIRKTYSSRISSYGFVFDNDSNLISIKDYGYSMDGKFPDMKGSSSVSKVRPNKRETITQIAKITSPAFAKKIYQHVNKVNESVNEGIKYSKDGFVTKMENEAGKVVKDITLDGEKFVLKGNKYVSKKGGKDLHKSHFGIKESVNEASKLAMGIAGFTGTRGDAVDDFINTHNIDAKKLFNFVKKGNLKDRISFVSAIAGRPNNKMFKMITKQFGEGNDGGVPQGYNPTVENKKEVEQIAKKTKSETAFYDVLSKIEKKYGKRNYRLWLEKSLKDLGVNPKHYDYRTNAAAEEKLYQLTK